MTLIYSLSIVPGYEEYIKNGRIEQAYTKYYEEYKYITKEYQTYYILQYNKQLMTIDLIDRIGLLRSVIFYKNRLVSFTIPKFQSAELFMIENPELEKEDMEVTELIEGIMISVFYNKAYGINGGWEIATRNNIGGNTYVTNTKKIKDLFREACKTNNLCLHILNPNYCYNFILQHPEYKLKLNIFSPQIYLIEVYEIRMNKYIYKLDIKDIINAKEWYNCQVKTPKIIDKQDYTQLIKEYGSGNSDYKSLGVVLLNKKTGKRAKILNPIYNQLDLDMNNYKSLYKYLMLRYNGKMKEYLEENNEKKKEWSVYRDMVHMYTNTLFQNYMDFYVKKIGKIEDYGEQYRMHMKILHKKYINEFLPKKLYMNNTRVKEYVNKLLPKHLIYSLLFVERRQKLDNLQVKE